VLRHWAQLLEVLTKYGELFELSLDVGEHHLRHFPPRGKLWMI
jgi:hypothetical protein